VRAPWSWTHRAGFLGLREEWSELVRASVTDSPFLTWEWLHTWWTHLCGSRQLALLTVRRGNSLIAVAPLSISRDRLPWLSHLEFLGTGWAGSDYLDVIAPSDAEDECVGVMSDWLRRQRHSLYLDHVPGEGATSARLAARLGGQGWHVRMWPSGSCPFARLAGHCWDSYLATLTPSHGSRFRRDLATLNKKFIVGFNQVASEGERQDALAALMKFHDQRWTHRGGSTAFRTPALRGFHQEVTRRALQGDWLRMFVLTLNDRPAAVAYCFLRNGRYYLYQHGFDAEYGHYSVGLVMLGLSIRRALDEGACEFDMLWGDEPYKFRWAVSARLLTRFELFPSHLGGRVHHHTLDAERCLRTLARRIFPRRPWNSNVPRAGVAS
jgi:CelD/BcsL family acetyltransferase involved in cellulose biosynthesis